MEIAQKTAEFTFKRWTYVLKVGRIGNLVFRDKEHLGGPWSDANSYLKDKGIHLGFRRALQGAVDTLETP